MRIDYLPNVLTISRIFFVPVIVISFYLEDNAYSKYIGAVAFLLASITDFFDGYLARKYKIESKFGAAFDPITDKILIVSTLIMLVRFQIAGEIPCLIIIIREILVGGIREALAKGSIELPVTFIAKIKTTVQMISVFFLILAGNDTSSIIWSLGNYLLWVAAIITFYTGVLYSIESIIKINNV